MDLVHRFREDHEGSEGPVQVPATIIANPAVRPAVRRFYEDALAYPGVREPSSAFWQVLLQQHFPAHELYTVTGAACSADAIPLPADTLPDPKLDEYLQNQFLESQTQGICVHKYVAACDANLPVLWVSVERPNDVLGSLNLHRSYKYVDVDNDAAIILEEHGWSRMYGLQTYGPFVMPRIVDDDQVDKDGQESDGHSSQERDGDSEMWDDPELKYGRPWIAPSTPMGDATTSKLKHGPGDILRDPRSTDLFVKFVAHIKAHPPWEPAAGSGGERTHWPGIRSARVGGKI